MGDPQTPSPLINFLQLLSALGSLDLRVLRLFDWTYLGDIAELEDSWQAVRLGSLRTLEIEGPRDTFDYVRGVTVVVSVRLLLGESTWLMHFRYYRMAPLSSGPYFPSFHPFNA